MVIVKPEQFVLLPVGTILFVERGGNKTAVAIRKEDWFYQYEERWTSKLVRNMGHLVNYYLPCTDNEVEEALRLYELYKRSL